jgi:predicted subunit of tRNA(5-methylaminomethyl-2-thiouridylate) methyltransferase
MSTQKIRNFGKCTNQMLLNGVRQDLRLKKLAENNLISITNRWEKVKINPKTGSWKRIIKRITPLGAYKN